MGILLLLVILLLLFSGGGVYTYGRYPFGGGLLYVLGVIVLIVIVAKLLGVM
jgi:hypothetical protein